MDKGKSNIINRDNVKLNFAAPGDKFSRRELLTFSWLSRDEMPFIDNKRCQGYEECGLCVAGCPLGAVEVKGDRVAIDVTRCSGCGACVEACPVRAIAYTGFSPEDIDRKLEGLSIALDKSVKPGIVAIVCQRCLPDWHYEGALTLSVPCMAMISPWLVLRAFDRGADGLAIITGGDCHSGYDPIRVQDNVDFVKELFRGWNIGRERISIINFLDEGRLGEFAGEVADLGPAPLGALPPSVVPEEGLRLPALIKAINERLGISSFDAIVAGAVPFGRVTVEHSRCTGCSLCALDCPTGALDISSAGEADNIKLIFKHEDCVACGRCVEVCPEKCLSLERVLELDELGATAITVFEDTVVRCAECGEPVGSRGMIDSVKAKLISAGQSLPEGLELCQSCKVKAQFKSWGEFSVMENR